MDQASDCGADQFIPSIRPIYGSSPNGVPLHIGTGILLEWKGEHFFLTAAHIIDKNSISTLYLGLGDSLKEISTSFNCTSKPNNDRSLDYYDFAWTQLSNITSVNSDECTFITPDQIEPSYGYQERNAYLALGYPISKNKKLDIPNHMVTPKYMKYMSSLDLSCGWTKERSLNCKDHLILKYHHKYAKDSEGKQVKTLSPKGVSGGALVNMGALHEPETYRLGHTPKGKLSGMLIENSKNHNVLVAVKIKTIIEQIEKSML